MWIHTAVPMNLTSFQLLKWLNRGPFQGLASFQEAEWNRVGPDHTQVWNLHSDHQSPESSQDSRVGGKCWNCPHLLLGLGKYMGHLWTQSVGWCSVDFCSLRYACRNISGLDNAGLSNVLEILKCVHDTLRDFFGNYYRSVFKWFGIYLIKCITNILDHKSN